MTPHLFRAFLQTDGLDGFTSQASDATMSGMLRPLLSVLLLGMVPSSGVPLADRVSPMALEVAPPAELLAHAPALSASGVLVLDMRSGQSLYAVQSDVQRPMASLTKLMTALIIVENHDLSEEITIPAAATAVVGNKAYLPAGETFTVGDVLTAMLVPSGNDAAEALAMFHAGTTEEFVRAMNRRAAILGLKGTSYANPAGLDDPRQWSTPRDLAWLTVYALRHPAIAERMHMPSATIVGSRGTTVHLQHTHALVRTPGAAVAAGKTGTTGAAGECLVSVVGTLEDPRYVVVLLHSAQRYEDMRRVLTSLPALDRTALTVHPDRSDPAYGG